MRILKACLVYFSLVFLAGFAMGLVRVPLLVPRLGVRLAEVLEMPLMLVVIVCSARYVVHRYAPLACYSRLFIGLAALLLLAVTELLFASLLQDLSPAQYVASRDPVSGSVYLGMLALFAAMPILQRNGQRPNNSFKPNPLRGSNAP
jgi:uncharacterized membrane protein (DUF485 family)